MAGYYDKNKDYSKELQRTDLSSSERAQLTQERQNKINDRYGGKEPNMTGSNKTYSQTYGGSSSGSSKGSYNGIEYDRSNNGGGIYGVPTSNSQQKNYKQGGVTYQVGADMSRRPDLAGGYAVSNGYTVFYDNNGYAYKASKGTVDYTPHQDINAGNGSYNKSGAWTDNEMLSAADKQKIADIRAQMQAGKITGDQANQAANAIRAGYGYSIDKNGYVTDNGALSRVNDRRAQLGLSTNPEDASTGYYRYLMGTDTSPLAQAAGLVKSYDEFNGTYTPTDVLQGLVNNGFNTSDAGRPSFDYTYDPEMRALIDQILNSNLADWKQGDQYAALKDQYAANGEMGMNDLLGQVSSRTGGLASSYAASVANQEYNDWMSKLEQAAQEMYQQDRSDKLNNLGVLNDAYNREYGEYGDKLNQWNTDRNFAYQQAQDALANQWKQKEWDYNMSQDEYNRLAQQADNLAAYGDFSGYKALGYTDSQINKMRQAYQIAQTAKAQSGSRSSGRQSSGSKKSGDSGMKLSVAKDNAKQGIFTPEVLDAFHKEGYSDDYLESAYGYNNPASASNFNRAYNSLMISLSEESSANAEKNLNKFVDEYWDYLSDSQKKQVTQLASNYGFQM
jgi:hypothetical protein|nr:MAG TPA: hypothetical protein [Caudoviricetes sp.]